MKGVVLDTTVASALLSKSLIFRLYEPSIGTNSVAISFQTIGEMLDGAHGRGFGGKRWRALIEFLDDLDVVSYSFDLAQDYARVRDLSRRQGRELQVADAWVAAAAIRRKAQLLTHDTDFVGLKIPGLHVVCFA
jgi:predicted nucleic acid-binding protein